MHLSGGHASAEGGHASSVAGAGALTLAASERLAVAEAGHALANALTHALTRLVQLLLLLLLLLLQAEQLPAAQLPAKTLLSAKTLRSTEALLLCPIPCAAPERLLHGVEASATAEPAELDAVAHALLLTQTLLQPQLPTALTASRQHAVAAAKALPATRDKTLAVVPCLLTALQSAEAAANLQAAEVAETLLQPQTLLLQRSVPAALREGPADSVPSSLQTLLLRKRLLLTQAVT